jgi:hypothetical protein
MPQNRRIRSPRGLFGALALLLLIVAMLPLSSFLAGFLPGGGELPAVEPAPADDGSDGTLRVTVVGADHRDPVAGARILVERLTGGEAQAESDAPGQVVLEGLGPGPVRVEASVNGDKAETWADPSVDPEVYLAVAENPKRTGTVRYADGTPADALVLLLNGNGKELAAARTDPKGRYEVADDAEAAAVCVQAKRGAPTVAPDGDVVVDSGVEIQGRLAGAGKGLLMVYGRVPAAEGDGVLPLRSRWLVAEDGAFSGRLPANARAWGLFDGRPVRIAGGELSLPGAAAASGRVLRPDGTPAARAILVFRPLLDEDFPTPLPGLRVEADTQGEFSAGGFARVRYAVEVRAVGCATRIVPEVVPGPDPIVIALEKGYAVHGFVLDTAGLPVMTARVQAVGLPEESGAHPVASDSVDAKGRFHLAGLGGSHARVRISAPGYHATTLDRVRPNTKLRVVLQRK